MKRVLLGVLAVAACGDTTQTAPNQLHIDRPRDMAFACYGQMRLSNGGPTTTTQDITFSAMPMEMCDDYALTQPRVPAGQDDLSGAGGDKIPTPNYYGFILEP